VRKKTRPFYFGLLGYGIYFFTDYVVWYSILHVRHITGIDPFLFELYFSATYSMLEFSCITLMFEELNRWRIFWIAYLFLGWLAIGLLSQAFPFDDRVITIDRDMASQRWIQLAAAVGEYAFISVLAWKKKADLTYKKVILLFLLGFYVAFSMEATLMISGIRPIDWSVFYFNDFVEINTGVPVLYLLSWMFRTGWLKEKTALIRQKKQL
jgi:hypothetical protein